MLKRAGMPGQARLPTTRKRKQVRIEVERKLIDTRGKRRAYHLSPRNPERNKLQGKKGDALQEKNCEVLGGSLGIAEHQRAKADGGPCEGYGIARHISPGRGEPRLRGLIQPHWGDPTHLLFAPPTPNTGLRVGTRGK